MSPIRSNLNTSRGCCGCSFLSGMWWTKWSRWFLAAISWETSLPLLCWRIRLVLRSGRNQEGVERATGPRDPGSETRSLVAAYMPGCAVHVQPGSVEGCRPRRQRLPRAPRGSGHGRAVFRRCSRTQRPYRPVRCRSRPQQAEGRRRRAALLLPRSFARGGASLPGASGRVSQQGGRPPCR
jgi:hypothetical protein